MRWLSTWRRMTILIIALGLGAQTVAAPGQFPVAEGAAWLVGLGAVDMAETMLLRRVRPREWMAVAHVALNLAVLGRLAWAFRAGDHPSLLLLILQVGAMNIVLRRPVAYAVTTAVIALYAFLVAFAPRLVPLPSPLPGEQLGRMAGQITTFIVASGAVAWFVTEVQVTLRDREGRLQSALDEHNSSARLAALGIQAAGIAHELGTPLSSIDMLAAEAQSYPDDAAEALATLRAQIQRCRGILNRVRDQSARTISPETEGLGLALREWIDEWAAAGPGRAQIQVEIPTEVDAAFCRGSADDWRSVIWTGLDNALKAGAPLVVRARRNGAAVVVELDDSGPGPSQEMQARAGEAFFTAWPGGGGRGLGLFAARTFARRCGGDVILHRREGGGGRLEVRFGKLDGNPSTP